MTHFPPNKQVPVVNDNYDYDIGGSGNSYKMQESIGGSQGSANQFFDPLGLASKKPQNQIMNEAVEKPKQETGGLTSLANLPNPLSKPKVEAKAAASGWDDDDWNFDDFEKPAPKKAPTGDIDLNSKEYKNKNLNKLSDAELAREKAKMDKKFEENFIKPGDPGYVYDKVVDFTNVQQDASDSWDNEEYSNDWN